MKAKQIQGGLVILISLAFCVEYYEKYPYSCVGIILLIIAIIYSYSFTKQKKEEEAPINRNELNFKSISQQQERLILDDSPRFITLDDPSKQSMSKPLRRFQATEQIKEHYNNKYREEQRQIEKNQRIVDMYSQSAFAEDDDDENEQDANAFRLIKEIQLTACLLSDYMKIRDPYAQMFKFKRIYYKIFLPRFLNLFGAVLYHLNIFSVKYFRIKISEYNYFYEDEFFNRGQETRVVSLIEFIKLTKKDQRYRIKIEQHLNQNKDLMEQYYGDRRQFMKDRKYIKLMWRMLDINYSDRVFPIGHRKRVLERLIAFRDGSASAKYQNLLNTLEPSDGEIILVTFYNLINIAIKFETKKYKDTKLVLYYNLFAIRILEKGVHDQMFNKKSPKPEDKYWIVQRDLSSDITVHLYSAQVSQLIKSHRKEKTEFMLYGYAGNDNVFLALYYYILSIKVYGQRRLDQMESLDYDTHFLLWILDFAKRL